MRQTGSAGTKNVWIIGAGKFGRRAAAALGKDGCLRITVVDRRLPGGLPPAVEAVEADGLDWLHTRLRENDAQPDTLIIPAVPLHLAADWLALQLEKRGCGISRPPIADAFLDRLPNALRLSPASAAVSHAAFLCPPDCREPEEICTATGRQRPRPLFRLLAEKSRESYTPLIIRSRQLAAGVGGFQAAELWRIYRRARVLPKSPLLIGTACKCHGIIDSLLID